MRSGVKPLFNAAPLKEAGIQNKGLYTSQRRNPVEMIHLRGGQKKAAIDVEWEQHLFVG